MKLKIQKFNFNNFINNCFFYVKNINLDYLSKIVKIIKHNIKELFLIINQIILIIYK